MFDIIPERPEHGPTVERLLDKAFGPGRYAKTAYRLREGVAPVPELSFVIGQTGTLYGSLRFWPVLIGRKHPALMLGPLAVEPEVRGQGMGIAVMEHALAKAAALGHRICMLVGDEPYYARVGFSRALGKGLEMPGPVDPARLLAKELVPGAMNGVSGMVGKPLKTALPAFPPPGQNKAAE